jgi:hypothetical protein
MRKEFVAVVLRELLAALIVIAAIGAVLSLEFRF